MKLMLHLILILIYFTSCDTSIKDVTFINDRYITVKSTFDNPSDVTSYEVWNNDNKDSTPFIFYTEIDSLHEFKSLLFHPDSNTFTTTLDNYQLRKNPYSDKIDSKYFICSDLVSCNYRGELKDVYYKSEDEEQVYHPVTSNSNQIIFFLTTNNKQRSDEPQFVMSSLCDLNIYSIPQHKVISKISNLCFSLKLGIGDNMFNPNENSIIFSISDGVSVIFDGKKAEPTFNNENNNIKIHENGIYIFDILTQKFNKIIDKGRCPIWNPTNNDEFIYISDERNEIYSYLINEKIDKKLYSYNTNRKIKDLFFSPNGRYILVTGWDNGFWSKGYFEELIEVETGLKVTHKLIGIEDTEFTWRK